MLDFGFTSKQEAPAELCQRLVQGLPQATASSTANPAPNPAPHFTHRFKNLHPSPGSLHYSLRSLTEPPP